MGNVDDLWMECYVVLNVSDSGSRDENRIARRPGGGHSCGRRRGEDYYMEKARFAIE